MPNQQSLRGRSIGLPMRIILPTLLFLALCPNSFAQSPAPPAFEVASIKPAAIKSDGYFAGRTAAGTCGKTKINISGNRVTLSFISLCGLIRLAYGVQDYQIVGVPKPMSKADPSNYYDIEARAAGEGALTSDRALMMLRSLLDDRFQLKLHRETRDLPFYALVIGRNGSKLSVDGQGVCGAAKATAGIAARTSTFGPGMGFMNCQPNTSAAQLADMLTPETDRPVLDRTGLTGKYAFQLRWTPEGATVEPNSPPSFFTAVQEQLGLRLDPQKGPVEVLVIDQAERPTGN